MHPNSACKWETDLNNTQNANFYDGMSQSDSVSPWHLLVCGIDRFNLTNTNGLRDLDVRLTGSPVTNPDQSTSPAVVHCEGLALRPDGTIVKQISKSVTFTEHGSKRLDFNGEIQSERCLRPVRRVVHVAAIHDSQQHSPARILEISRPGRCPAPHRSCR